MTVTVAVANQKGGVAKTTSVVSLGAALAAMGLRVLLVDLDAQACLTFSLGIEPDDVKFSTYDLLTGERTGAEVALAVEPCLDLLPASIDLAGAEAALFGREHRELVLREALAPIAGSYDVVMMDCSPSLGLVTINALAAADEVVIPLQCEMLSHRGVGQLVDTVSDVQRLVNPNLLVRGLLPTMFDARTMHARAVLEDVGERYHLPVLSPPIPRSVRFAEAPALGRSILTTAGTSRGAVAYRRVATCLAESWGLSGRRKRR